MAFIASTASPACVLFEDEQLLVVNKPAGWNTHAPSPFAGEGIYDWLKHREPRWAALAIIHRLDKETSGLLVFGKTPLANRSLTQQFAGREVRKQYHLLTDRMPQQREFTARSSISRAGVRYVSGAHGEPAETRFCIVPAPLLGRRFPTRCHGVDDSNRAGSETGALVLVKAEPLTGRTHQIRVHAAEHGFPILGDTLYGGSPFPRVCLHAAELSFKHPATNETVTFSSPADLGADTRFALRAAILEQSVTDAFRLVQGASDGWPGWYVDRLGDFLLSQSDCEQTPAQQQFIHEGLKPHTPRVTSTYHKILSRQVRGATAQENSPQRILGEAAPERFTIRENGVQFELSFCEGYSVGLFLDQRDNRRRLLTEHVAAGFDLLPERRVARAPNQPSSSESRTRVAAPCEVLNCFAYTCGFSVCAALAGARTTSLDLSKKYLEWGKRNFALNGLDPAQHDFIYGDTFDWLKRLAKKQRQFDVLVLDPPTFSRSKESGIFRVERDYNRLVAAALGVLKPRGVLFCSTNAAGWPPEDFMAQVQAGVRSVKRTILHSHYVPQPPDFPVSRAEPAYLKTLWLRVS